MELLKFFEVRTEAGQRAAFLSPLADGLKDCYPDVRINGESTFEFKIPATSEKLAELTPECQIWAGGRVYSLLKENAIDIIRDEKNALWAKVMAVERWYDLDGKYIEPYISNDPNTPQPSDLTVIIVSGGSDLSEGKYTIGSAGHALYAVLKGSGWSVGTVDVTGTHDLETEKKSILANVKQIRETWGGYLVWDSVNKTVSLRSESSWKSYTGFQVRYRKNLKHITRTQSNKLTTKLYCFGKDGLDISSVNDGKKYITNFTYTSNTYIDIYENPDISDPQILKEKGTEELSSICKPKYLYRVKMVDLRTLPEYSHEDFAIGDMADIVDEDIGNARVRIIQHKYNLFRPWECELELGNPEQRLVENLKESFKTTEVVKTGVIPGVKKIDNQIVMMKTDIQRNEEQIQLKADKTTTDGLAERVTNAETTITQQAEQIELKANKTVTDALGNTLSNVISAITQQAEQIQLKVEKTDYTGSKVISIINQTTEAIKIAAKFIELAGAVTVSALSQDAINLIDSKTTSQQVTTITESFIKTTNVLAEYLQVKSANITGKLTAQQIETDSLGAMKIYKPGDPNNFAVIGGAYGDFILHYNSSEFYRIYNTLEGISHQYKRAEYLYTTGNNTYPTGTWDFGGASVEGIGWGEISGNPFTGRYPSDFAPYSHNHGNNYIKSPAGQDIGIQYYGGNLEFIKDGHVILSITV